ncbi:MAG: ABC transporter ATP-binding protein/permease [Ruminococcaceae bacterium]|nr:ABC transporter ATP-binding protein/permease [Oscillospiraceae bacterium]
MLQISDISKTYKTGNLVQQALDHVSLNLRDNEFVAVLGPSGSGKTTLLNIIGGLDRYETGNLVINGVSTKDYSDRDWDSYRNHTIGFVFQSYNLIPHQSILANVELALTISGFSRSERRKKAKQVLEDVGLGDQLHKKPNQLSGGQMQRVAIARALVNDPDILLADEPTGALDTETSLQVMELLKQVAKDRLVVMVTHNPDLAEAYATRIVRLRDGKITDDSDPYQPETYEKPQHRNLGRAFMSFGTALNLSFQNLRSKKARTILTAFAGSIGIIGIGLILSLSNGVNNYITDIQRDTMTSYPIIIEEQAMDFSSLIGNGAMADLEEADHPLDKVYMNSMDLELFSSFTSSVTENNLTAFKEYLDDPNSPIHAHIGRNGIVYSYDAQFGLYTYDSNGELVRGYTSQIMPASPMESMSMMSNMNAFQELLPGTAGQLVSPALMENYQVLFGDWPKTREEIVLVLNQNNEIPASMLYQLGILPAAEYREILLQLEAGEKIDLPEQSWSYKDICQQEFYLLPSALRYVEGQDGLFREIGTDAELEKQLKNALKLTICGVIRPYEDSNFTPITANLAYTQALTLHLIDWTEKSPVVQAQKQSPDTNVLSGVAFIPKDDAAKIQDAKSYIATLGVSDKAALFKEMLSQIYADKPQIADQLLAMSEPELAAMLDNYLKNPEDSVLLSIYDRYISPGSYEDNMELFGLISLDAPSAINIYTDSFEAKDAVAECIADYNEAQSDENQINYTDYVALLMSSVTTIVNVISYVLIAFVSVSLVVSSIMIGIITYISVLERTKEIGILRAIGASKGNISLVFDAETFIIGLCAGGIGVGITALLLLPCNAIIHLLVGNDDVNASLPLTAALILVVLSVVLTLIGGWIPAKKAAKKDPVTALRTE